MPHITNGIIPLAVLFAGLVAGGIAAIYLTKKITRLRVLRQIALAAQEAQAEEEFMGRKPILTDVYLGPPPQLSGGNHPYRLPWPDLKVRHVRSVPLVVFLVDRLPLSRSAGNSMRHTHVLTHIAHLRISLATHMLHSWTEISSMSLLASPCLRLRSTPTRQATATAGRRQRP